MRVQQKVTELAIKGDRVLGTLRPVEEKPSWATFDEDEPPTRNGASTVTELRPLGRVPPPRIDRSTRSSTTCRPSCPRPRTCGRRDDDEVAAEDVIAVASCRARRPGRSRPPCPATPR